MGFASNLVHPTLVQADGECCDVSHVGIGCVVSEIPVADM